MPVMSLHQTCSGCVIASFPGRYGWMRCYGGFLLVSGPLHAACSSMMPIRWRTRCRPAGTPDGVRQAALRRLPKNGHFVKTRAFSGVRLSVLLFNLALVHAF